MTMLVLAPHADDETLGMGGTIARAVDAGEKVVVAVLTGHGGGDNPVGPPEMWEPIRAECREAMARLGVEDLRFFELPAAMLDHEPVAKANRLVAELIAEVQPEELYVPFAHDLHRDHGAIAYAASVASRPYLPAARSIRRVYAYEVLSETHLAAPGLFPAFAPQHYVDVAATLERKLDAMRAYESQVQPDHLPRSIEGLRALARVRGNHIGSSAAEAFMLLGSYER